MIMKRWISLTGLSSAILALVFCSNKPVSGDEPLLKRLMITLNGQHYAPKTINDDFSLLAFENTLENLDGSKQFFTQQDIQKLKPFEKQIDDQINAGRFDFFDSAWNTLMYRLDQIEPWIVEPLKTPLNYSIEGNFEVSQENKNYALNVSGLKDYWTRWTRYQVVDRLYRKQKQQADLKKSKDTAGNVKIVPFDTLELKARNETKTFVENLKKTLIFL